MEEPLRIVLLDSIRTWGGGEAWCVAAARALGARGHRVAIACGEDSALDARAREAGLEVFTTRLTGAGAVLGAVALGRHLAAESFEIVVANVGRDVRLGAAACALADAKLVQRRGIARPLKRDALHRRLYGSAVRRVVANCEAIRSALFAGADFVDPARFVVIPNAVEAPDGVEAAPVRAELGIGDAPLAGSVGRLSPMKGLEVLVDAFPAVRERVPDARLLLVGEGELGEALRERVRERGLEGVVTLTGFRRDAPAVLAALDVVVVPSVRDEGNSNALLEAMARGVPSVVSDCGGLPETVAAGEDGEPGLLVPAGDAAALADALAGLLADPGRRAAMGAAARARASARYAPEVVWTAWEELLRAVRAEG